MTSNTYSSIVPDAPVKRLDDSVGIVDLMLTWNIARNHPTEREHLVVELKAPKVKIGSDELTQIKSYAFAVADDERFTTLDTKWHFWIISNELDAFANKEMAADTQGRGILYNADGVTIWVKTWGELINECKHRLEFIGFYPDFTYTSIKRHTMPDRSVHDQTKKIFPRI